MTDSVSGAPVFTLADLKIAGAGANQIGLVSDNDTFVITTPGTNASKVSLSGQATTFTTSGSGTGGTITVTVGSSGEVTKAFMQGGSGYVATDTIDIITVDGDDMDTDCVLTIQTEAFTVVRGLWSKTVTVAVIDGPGDAGDGNARSYFTNQSLNNVWVHGGAKIGGQAGNKSGPQIVIPE